MENGARAPPQLHAGRRPADALGMVFIRVATERLYLALFWIARTAFLTQGLALCTAMIAVPWSSRPDASPWVQVLFRSSLAIGATLFVTGVLLFVARHRITPREGDDAAPSWPWPLLLGSRSPGSRRQRTRVRQTSLRSGARSSACWIRSASARS